MRCPYLSICEHYDGCPTEEDIFSECWVYRIHKGLLKDGIFENDKLNNILDMMNDDTVIGFDYGESDGQ